MEQAETQTAQLYEDRFFKSHHWDESTRMVGIDWKEATSSMTDEEFKAELALFAGHVEQKKARGILADVTRFRHKPAPEICLSLCRRRTDSTDDGVAGREFSYPGVHQ